MPTPESYVKKRVSALLTKYRAWHYMPVPSGFGTPTLDYLGCIRGAFFAIEAKPPGKKPTPRQETTIRAMRDAGGAVFVVIGNDGLDELEEFLKAHSE
jgi:hypothetical protein